MACCESISAFVNPENRFSGILDTLTKMDCGQRVDKLARKIVMEMINIDDFRIRLFAQLKPCLRQSHISSAKGTVLAITN
jgi:hypothetical protein